MVEKFEHKTTVKAKPQTLEKNAEIKELMEDFKKDLTVEEFLSKAETLIGSYHDATEGIKLKLLKTFNFSFILFILFLVIIDQGRVRIRLRHVKELYTLVSFFWFR